VLAALQQPRPLQRAQSGDPAEANAAGKAIRRLPSNLKEARAAFGSDAVLAEAMGALLHSTLGDSMASEIRRAEGITNAQQSDADCWWPLVGGLG
jgi:glutamine synthetase